MKGSNKNIPGPYIDIFYHEVGKLSIVLAFKRIAIFNLHGFLLMDKYTVNAVTSDKV